MTLAEVGQGLPEYCCVFRHRLLGSCALGCLAGQVSDHGIAPNLLVPLLP